MLMQSPSTSIGQMVTMFTAQFPYMKQSDALSVAQNGMLSYIQTQQPAIPASVLAGAIQQLGNDATIDSVTNLASQTNVPQNLAALYSLASGGTSHGDASGYSVQIAPTSDDSGGDSLRRLPSIRRCLRVQMRLSCRFWIRYRAVALRCCRGLLRSIPKFRWHPALLRLLLVRQTQRQFRYSIPAQEMCSLRLPGKLRRFLRYRVRALVLRGF